MQNKVRRYFREACQKDVFLIRLVQTDFFQIGFSHLLWKELGKKPNKIKASNF